MLTLEIELLDGVYRAAAMDGTAPEWPPHTERIFSALVQAWADGGAQEREQRALEWLEGLPPPVIEASDHGSRDAPVVYVPPNDARGDQLAALPLERRRQARTFQAAVPDEPIVRVRWNVAVPADLVSPLERLARGVASLGHSASLVRFRFSPADAEPRWPRWVPDDTGRHVLRMPYAGRWNDLQRWFGAEGGRTERPRSRRAEAYRFEAGPPAGGEAPRPVFGGLEDWFVFEDAGGFRPDLLAFAHVARRMRDALMSVAPQPPSELLSGHRREGGPSERPHVAIVPLADVGWEHSSGELLGCAVVLPRGTPEAERGDVLRSLAAFAARPNDDGLPTGAQLRLGARDVWELERSPAPSRASLRPRRYCARARRWASVTPVVLDRHPDRGDIVEEARLVAAACARIDLPEPVEVELHKHSAVRGAPSAYLPRRRGAPSWSFPSSSRFRDRPRRHVVLTFAEDVEGPVLIGAGRYHGFGLCLPLDEEGRP